MDHFTRNFEKPIRYRHSIGSPSLSLNPIQSRTEKEAESTNETVRCYGDDEASRFFETMDEKENPSYEQAADTSEENVTELNLKCFIDEAVFRFNSDRLELPTKHVIIQRAPERFWNVLLRQNFDPLNHDLSIRFANEAGADSGGLMR